MSMAKREFPIHMVVREGHAEVVQLPLQAGAGSESVALYLVLGRARLRPHPKQGVCGRS